MPRVSIWLVRAALLHLLSGSLLGGFYLASKAVGRPLWVAGYRPAHVEQMLMGWMVQLVIGVAYWILPSRSDRTVSHVGLMWAVLALLNGGVLLAAAGPTLPGRCAETLAVALFAWHAWSRQRPFRPTTRQLVL